MKVFHSTPLLHADGESGKKQWQGFAAKTDGGDVVIYAEFGSVGGTIQKAKPSKVEAKNVGRTNETSPENQARSEIDAKCLKKQKEGYLPAAGAQAVAPEIIEHQKRILPMLSPSKIYPALASKIKFPALIQPKLDGMRVVTNGRDFWSRTGVLQAEKAIKHVRHDTKGLLVDGELMQPNVSFQKSMSAARSDEAKTIFYVFDLADLKLPYERRIATLQQFMEENPHPSWKLVLTKEVADDAEVQEFYAHCLEIGFEGSMVKNKAGLYRPGDRSVDVQKLKPVDDDEFEITGYEEADGNWAGTPVFHLVIHEGHKDAKDGSRGKVGAPFKAKPAMEYDEAAKLYKDCCAGKVVGAWATINFQGFYDQKPGDPKAGKPRFPRLKAIRDYE